MRFRGSGEVDLTRGAEDLDLTGRPWQVVLTTEDVPFTTDPEPVEVDRSGPAPILRFARPSAVILRTATVRLPVGPA